MSISELGSLGEFIASLAVLVTLVLLLFQFRSARREISGQVTREIKRLELQVAHLASRLPSLPEG